jgi:hypothetical protein
MPAGDVLAALGFSCSLSMSSSYKDDTWTFSFTAKVPGIETEEYVSKVAKSLGSAAQKFAEKANDIIANPPPVLLRDPAAVKDAALALVNEYRATGTPPSDENFVDELADRIAALPVKE